MKKVLSTLIAVAFATAFGVAFADDEDEALNIAPNAQHVVTSSAPTGPVVYDRDDDAMNVAPNAQIQVEQTTYIWGTYPTD
jgi:hypothetical protein